MPKNRKYPGVYIQEQSAFPNSIAGLPTAVPAFIGYTPQATFRGASFLMKPVKISSFADFKAYFCWPDPRPPADPTLQYAPTYYLQELAPGSTTAPLISIQRKPYALLPDPDTIYYLYNSVRLFYQNGGGDAYIVSVGTYGAPSGKSIEVNQPIVNKNVQLNDLLKGLAALKKEQEPTLYICPEATLLSLEDNATLMQAMLLQNEQMGTAMSLLDIIGARDPDPVSFMDDITAFRENTGTRGLEYGAAYYPFIGTTITQPEEVSYTNLFGGDLPKLSSVLGATADNNEPVYKLLKEIASPTDQDLNIAQYHQALLRLSPDYKTIIKHLLEGINLLPPSGALAGIYNMIDNSQGVWKAPANVSIAGAISLPIHLNNQQQADLNVDAMSGKSVNAIRSFPGMGILVWGSRTLDGHNAEGRYIPVQRTLMYIEQSCQAALEPFVFEPNDQNTWTQIRAMIENFLTNLWKQGGLAGAKPADAYYVLCGLGTTMTAQDLANNRLIVILGVAMVRPVEFMTIRLELRMAD